MITICSKLDLFNLHHLFLMQLNKVQKPQLLLGLTKILLYTYLKHVGFLVFCYREKNYEKTFGSDGKIEANRNSTRDRRMQ